MNDSAPGAGVSTTNTGALAATSHINASHSSLMCGDASLSSPMVLQPLSTSSDANRKKKYAEQDKKKREEQRKQGMALSEDEIIVENGTIVSINNLPIASISLEALKTFAQKLRLKIRSNISKACLCKELANYKELEPQRDMIVQNITQTGQKNGTSNKNCVLPANLQYVNGTIFRVILTILDSDNRDAYLGTGQQIDRGALGAGEGHLTNYAFLCAVYNDVTNEKYDSIGLDTLSHQDIYDCYACYDEISSSFDTLTTNQFTQVLKFVNKKYRQARINNEKSGTHDDFHMFIMGLPWLLFYHERMEELGDFSTTYSNLAYPCLPEEVFITSDGSSNNSSSSKKQNRTKDRSQELNDAKLRRGNAIAAKNEESKKLLEDETQLSLKRKRYNEVLDLLFDLESKLRDEELKLHEEGDDEHDGFTKRRVDLLNRKMDNLRAEESHIQTFLARYE